MTDQATMQTEANIYGFLARLWIAELDEPTFSQIQSGELHEAWKELGGAIPDLGSTEGAIEELAIEFCACFLGPKGHLPPHQSVVSHSRFQGDCLGSLNQFIEIIGKPNGQLFQEQQMADHAGVLLALMQRVCAYGAQCDDSDEEAVAQLRSQFFESHLQWLIDYCAVAAGKSKSAFYTSLFDVTAEFLRAEVAK